MQLDEASRTDRNKILDLESKMDQMVDERAKMLDLQDELRTDIAEKINLLDEFEQKFERQYK